MSKAGLENFEVNIKKKHSHKTKKCKRQQLISGHIRNQCKNDGPKEAKNVVPEKQPRRKERKTP